MIMETIFSPSLLANSLALASLLTMLSGGLALIYGLRGVLNFGHGVLYTMGAYAGYSISAHTNFWIALVAAPLLMAAVGIAFEYGVLRPLRKRTPIDIAIITYGVALIASQLILMVYGGQTQSVQLPAVLDRSVWLIGTSYPLYRLFLIVVGIGTCVAVAAWLKWSRLGLQVRAVSNQPQVSRMMGVNTDRLSLLVVCLGTGFAGLAGVLAGPYLSVDPGMGQAIFISCLIIVVIGGLGSIGGTVIAAVAYGFIQVIGTVAAPELAVLIPYVLLIAVLLWRPHGITRKGV
jgi:branched-chain amino acid transport system permease protein